MHSLISYSLSGCPSVDGQWWREGERGRRRRYTGAVPGRRCRLDQVGRRARAVTDWLAAHRCLKVLGSCEHNTSV